MIADESTVSSLEPLLEQPAEQPTQDTPYKKFLRHKDLHPSKSTKEIRDNLKLSATEIFRDALEKYSSTDEARTHINQIAEEIGCSASLGRKTLDSIAKFAPSPTAENMGQEPTAKIDDVPLMPLPPIDTITDTGENIGDLSQYADDDAHSVGEIPNPTPEQSSPSGYVFIEPNTADVTAAAFIATTLFNKAATTLKDEAMNMDDKEAKQFGRACIILFGDKTGRLDPRALAALTVATSVGVRIAPHAVRLLKKMQKPKGAA